MKKVAVIFSGCGVFDGAEIQESVLTLLAIAKNGAQYQCFAPNMPQMHVVDHLSGEVSEGESRNVLVEAARIARGEIQDLAELKVDQFDALILPGGFGAAKNLCDFAVKGADCEVHPDVLRVCQAFSQAAKPCGYICIAPAMIPLVYGEGATGTIGNDLDTAAAIESMGGRHVACLVEDFVVDEQRKVVSTPAYMLAGNILEAEAGISKLVAKVIEMA